MNVKVPSEKQIKAIISRIREIEYVESRIIELEASVAAFETAKRERQRLDDVLKEELRDADVIPPPTHGWSSSAVFLIGQIIKQVEGEKAVFLPATSSLAKPTTQPTVTSKDSERCVCGRPFGLCACGRRNETEPVDEDEDEEIVCAQVTVGGHVRPVVVANLRDMMEAVQDAITELEDHPPEECDYTLKTTWAQAQKQHYDRIDKLTDVFNSIHSEHDRAVLD